MDRTYARKNPFLGLTTEEWVIIGLGTAVVGTLVWAVTQVQESAQNAADSAAGAGTAAQAAADQASGAADQVGEQLYQVQQTGTAVQGQIASAQQQAAPITSTAQGLQNWWNSL
jgi:uncharacterized membrane protein